MSAGEQVLSWRGSATALSSVVHGGEPLGTVTYLRREKLLMPDGTVDDIPMVSGNAVRGVMRDAAADLWWESVGEPELTVAVAHAIWSGGALAKATREPLTGARLLDVFEVCPVIEVFGAAGGGRIVNGAVRVGKLVPVCEETRHILQQSHPWLVERSGGGGLPSIWDLTQLEWLSRNPEYPKIVSKSDVTEPPTGMRFGVESFLAGTVFASSFSLTYASPAAVGLFAEVLEGAKQELVVGGRGGSGHGHVAFTFTEEPDVKRLPKPGSWRRYVKKRNLSIDDLRVLGRLD